MSAHIDNRIAELLLGDVSDGEREQLEAHVAGCARCNQELMLAADAFAAMALALPAEAPPPSLRKRILDDAKAPRYAAMLARVAELFDIGVGKARALLDKLDDPAAWVDGPVPNSWVFMSDVRGPKLEGAFCGFVKMGPSVKWPAHKHLGREFMLVLEGGFKEDDRRRGARRQSARHGRGHVARLHHLRRRDVRFRRRHLRRRRIRRHLRQAGRHLEVVL